MPVTHVAPALARLLAWRAVLGVRHLDHTLVKTLNPLDCPALCLVGVTHAPYRTLLQAFFTRNCRDALLLRGSEGESMASAHRLPPVTWCHAGVTTEFEGWQRAPVAAVCTPDAADTSAFTHRALADPGLNPRPLLAQAELVLVATGAVAEIAGGRADRRSARRPGGRVVAAGCVSLVGAGPGDPELLTLKVVRALRRADVVLVDDLVDAAVIDYCRPDARILHVGKRGGCRSAPQAVVERLLIREARAGNRVVRLKGGAPFMFRGWRGNGAPAAVGIPLTHRDLSHGATFVTGHAQPAGVETDWAALAVTGMTLVIYMGMRRLPQIVAGLRDGGLPDSTPVAVIENASLPTQRALASVLADVVTEVAREGLGSPSVIVVG